MKQKTDSNKPVTKAELSKILKYYPTKEELRNELMQTQIESNNKLDQQFIERLVKGQAASRAESDYKFSIMQQDLDTKFSKFTNRILTALDPLIQDMKIRQQEREVVAGQIGRVEEDVENLDRRVTKLEHS